MKSKQTLNEFKQFVIAIFDNSQFNIKRKFQRNGISSNMAEATCRMFIEPTLPKNLPDIPDDWSDLATIPITYIDQIVPSPYGMPPYENLHNDWTFQDLQQERFSTFTNNIDVTGERVAKYYEMKRTIGYTRRLKRIIPYSLSSYFMYSIPEFTEVLSNLFICEKLKHNWQRTYPSDSNNVQCSFYHHLLKTLYTYPQIWRGQVTPAKLLIPPVSPENETTNRGAANVVMSLLLYHGIVVPVSNQGANGDVKEMRLAEDYGERYVMLVGDGLSQVRVQTFENMIQESSFCFKENFRATDMIRKALEQVIHVTGDLHGGRFHFLAVIYSLFYGSLIQYIQVLLGWKRIRGTDVTKCYQQAAGLVLMTADEGDKLLITAYLHDVFHNNMAARQWLCNEGSSVKFALLIAKGYRAWLQEKQRTTTDAKFRKLVNFVLIVDDYREFRMALNTGDAVMIECLYRDFLPEILLDTEEKLC